MGNCRTTKRHCFLSFLQKVCQENMKYVAGLSKPKIIKYVAGLSKPKIRKYAAGLSKPKIIKYVAG